jgi:thioredoxin 1
MPLSQLNDSSLPAFLAAAQAPALLCFTASWSRAARNMLPVIEQLSKEYHGLVRFGVVDSDQSPDALSRYGILTLPTYLFIRAGKQTGRFIGAMARDTLVERIEESLQRVN